MNESEFMEHLGSTLSPSRLTTSRMSILGWLYIAEAASFLSVLKHLGSQE